jgi:hypothetical protein
MLIELIMFSAAVMVGIALLVSDPIKRVYSITTSMNVMVRAHLPSPLVLEGKSIGSNRGRCAIERSAILDFRSPSQVHPKISRSICERVFDKHFCEAVPKPLHAPEENYSIPTVAFEDVRDKLSTHNRRVIS